MHERLKRRDKKRAVVEMRERKKKRRDVKNWDREKQGAPWLTEHVTHLYQRAPVLQPLAISATTDC